MGYNNNHAGMHMIWYRRKYSYDDLEYYDRKAESSPKVLEKKVPELEKEDKSLSEKPVEEKPAGEKSFESVEQKQTKHPQKKKNAKNKQVMQPEKKKVIEDRYFKNTIDWYANIYLIAFERKLDIYDAICECEHLCEEDLRMSEGYSNYFDTVTSLDKAIVFLNMLADKMGCEVYEFILPNEEMRSKRVYRILDKFDEEYCKPSSIVSAFEYGVEGEGEDETDANYVIERLSLFPYLYLNHGFTPEGIPEFNMQYYFYKVTAKGGNSIPIYFFSVMARKRFLRLSERPDLNFMYNGSDIISEKEGKLADFFEKTKKVYLENGGTISHDLDYWM